MSSFCCDPSRYLPHRTPMLLIDRVLAADAETTRCRVTVGEQCSLFRQAEGDVFDIDTRCLFFGQEELPSQFECRVLENNTEVASAVLTVYRPRDLQEFVRTNFARQ